MKQFQKTSLIIRLAIIPAILAFAVSVVTAQVKMHVIDVGQADAVLLELPNDLILVDAGSETTDDNRYEDALIKYLDNFFAGHLKFEKTLHTIVISHPHIDHTKNLVTVMNRYAVKNFIDGGATTGSGISQIKKARQIASQKGIAYFKVSADDIKKTSLLKDWRSELLTSSDVKIRFLSGGRTCNDANNASLVMRVEYQGKSILLTGDAEEDDLDWDKPGDTGCGGLLFRLLNSQAAFPLLLDTDVLKAAHHGARNGSTKAFLKKVSPLFTVISAGHPETRSTASSGYHAFFFGHPNEESVAEFEKFTTASRTEKTVTTFTAPEKSNQRKIKKAVYATVWDGTIVVSIAPGGAIQVDTAEN